MNETATPAGALPDEATLLRALSTVIDPEAGIDIVALGLVYGIHRSDRQISIDLTMTSPACPMGEMIMDEAHAAVTSILPEGVMLTLNLVWEPPWSPECMHERARRHFGWDDTKGADVGRD